MQIIQSPSPNFSSRHGRTPIAIVDHITSGAHPECCSWLCNPESQASAHYVVARSGELDQLVQDEYAAWHAGAVKNPNWPLWDGTNPNWYTLGIEHEGYDGTLTELQYQSTLWLHKMLIQKWSLPINTDTIIGHYRIDSVNRPNCPGPNFPWQRLFADLTVQPVNIAVGDKVVQGIIEGDRSFAPIRAIMGILGLRYGWEGIDAQSGYAIIGPSKVFTIIRNNTGYAKVQDLAQAIGRQVAWDGSTNTATII